MYYKSWVCQHTHKMYIFYDYDELIKILFTKLYTLILITNNKYMLSHIIIDVN